MDELNVFEVFAPRNETNREQEEEYVLFSCYESWLTETAKDVETKKAVGPWRVPR